VLAVANLEEVALVAEVLVVVDLAEVVLGVEVLGEVTREEGV